MGEFSIRARPVSNRTLTGPTRTKSVLGLDFVPYSIRLIGYRCQDVQQAIALQTQTRSCDLG